MCGDHQGHLFRRARIFLDLRVAEMLLEIIQQSTSERPFVEWESKIPVLRLLLNFAGTFQRNASRNASMIAKADPSVKGLFDMARSILHRVEECNEFILKEEARQYVLPRLNFEMRHFRNPELKLPVYSSNALKAITNEEIRERTMQNIGWIPMRCNLEKSNFTQLLRWFSELKDEEGDPEMWMAICGVEKFMFKKAMTDLDSNDAPVLDENELKSLESIVTEYRCLLHRNQSVVEAGYDIATELRSRELLVIWIAYCLCFKTARTRFSEILGNVGVALSYQDLQHLVLSDKEAWEVSRKVATFLHNNHSKGGELFSLSEQPPTFVAAERYSRAHLGEVFDQEKANASHRIEEHWDAVQCKKKGAEELRSQIEQHKGQASKLRGEIARLDCQLFDLSCEIESIQKTSFKRHILEESERRQRTLMQQRVNSVRDDERLKTIIHSLECELVDTLSAPPPVCQPLPKNEIKAHQLLSFLHMPPLFRFLAHLTLLGQQLLCCPIELDEEEKAVIVTSGDPNSLATYYNSHQMSSSKSHPFRIEGKDGCLHLRSHRSIEIPRDIGPKSVDSILSKDQGIWYPDVISPRMAWTGGENVWDRLNTGQEFKPFALSESAKLVAFTETLCESDHKSLQAYIRGDFLAGVKSRTRGSIIYANQIAMPSWLLKDQFFAFGGMRAYPNSQLRNLLRCLVDCSLPISNESVKALLRQTLYQIGTISPDDSSRTVLLSLKRDLYNGAFAASALPVLQHMAANLEESPKNEVAAYFIGHLASFLSSWDNDNVNGEEFKKVSQGIANAIYGWGKQLQIQIDKTENESEVYSLRARLVMFYLHSVLFMSKGVMSPRDCGLIIELVARSRNIDLENGNEDDKVLLFNLRSACLRASSSIIQVLQNAVETDPNLLTEALKSVVVIDFSRIDWTRIGALDSWCFEGKASNGTGDVYALNILTGIILVNGLPPSSLPNNICNHPLFRRVFGKTNFEVTLMQQGIFRTIRTFNGKRYEFYMEGSDSLCVAEIDTDGNRLDLLDSVNEWGNDLPLRLRSMFSHWICDEKGCIVVRDTLFSTSKVHFMLASSKGLCDWHCYRIPSHLSGGKWPTLLAQYLGDCDRLVLLRSDILIGSELLKCMSKVENPSFIHFYLLKAKSSNLSTFRMEFPRLGLTFTINGDGALVSDQWPSHRLATAQLLSTSMQSFKNYLVLEHTAELDEQRQRSILVLDGVLKMTNSQEPVMLVNDDCNLQCSYHYYETHPRLNVLVSKSVAGRLMLAALHLCTSCIVPDKMSQLTGEERAIQLVRQCWSTRPLKKNEEGAIQHLMNLSQGVSPVLFLLCKDVLQSSMQTGFLLPAGNSSRLADLHTHDMTAYFLEVKSAPCTPRRRLSQAEERRVLGRVAFVYGGGLCKIHEEKETSCDSRIFEQSFTLRVNDIEMRLGNLIQRKETIVGTKEFPLPSVGFGGGTISSALEQDFVKDLRDSWTCHVGNPKVELKEDMRSLDIEIRDLLFQTRTERRAAESHLLYSITRSSRQETMTQDFLRLSGDYPQPTVSDYIRIGYDPSHIDWLNPSISSSLAKNIIRHDVITWMRLCRAEDKIRRIQGLSTKEERERELSFQSLWPAEEHPEWLAFEVEGQLQIRQDQYVVATHLIENPAQILQLNMGMGKTRIILPILIIHWTFGNKCDERICRLNVLSALLGEAYDFFHLHLCASVAEIKVFVLPFSRSVSLDKIAVARIKCLIYQCKKERGFFLVAPEHRLSLLLKDKELIIIGNEESGDRSFICSDKIWRDILDESDELLHTRCQLIYAIGDVRELPSGPHRWLAAQTVFKTLVFDAIVKRWLDERPDTVSVERTKGCEAFPKTRIANNLLTDYERSSFRQVVAQALIKSPPYELDWLNGHVDSSLIMDFICLPEASATCFESMPENQMEQLLAIRGYLAGGILLHCLSKRNRVDYGINEFGVKRIAIPYRGAETPSLRSEFSDPDCSIVWT